MCATVRNKAVIWLAISYTGYARQMADASGTKIASLLAYKASWSPLCSGFLAPINRMGTGHYQDGKWYSC